MSLDDLKGKMYFPFSDCYIMHFDVDKCWRFFGQNFLARICHIDTAVGITFLTALKRYIEVLPVLQRPSCILDSMNVGKWRCRLDRHGRLQKDRRSRWNSISVCSGTWDIITSGSPIHFMFPVSVDVGEYRCQLHRNCWSRKHRRNRWNRTSVRSRTWDVTTSSLRPPSSASGVRRCQYGDRCLVCRDIWPQKLN